MKKKLYCIMSFALGLSLLINPISLRAENVSSEDDLVDGTEVLESTEESLNLFTEVNRVEGTESVESTESVENSTENDTESIAVIDNNIITSWSDYHFEDMSRPSDGTKLVYSDIFSLDTWHNYFMFELPEGSYKILSYNVDDGNVYGTTSVVVDIPEDTEYGTPASSSTQKEVVAYTNPADLETILNNEPVINMDNPFYVTCKNAEGYILVFNDNATDISGLKFVCKIDDLLDYSAERIDTYEELRPSDSATSSVSLVKKIYDDTNICTRAKFKVSFNLGTIKKDGVDTEEKAAALIVDNGIASISLNDLNSGEVNFNLINLENKEYSYYIVSENNFKYEGSFTVDFVSKEEEDNEDLVISDIVPTVTFDGFPSDKVATGTAVTMKMNTSNVDSMMNFNGSVLGNSSYGKSFEFTVSRNGEYFYSASTLGGKTVEGTLVIDFFEDVTEVVEDPINSDLVDINDGEKLEQTGFGYSLFFIILAIGLISVGSLVLIDKKFHFIKFIGGKINENK